MILAVASGKGGTGKTTVATNLALMASRQGRSVAYLDCDVEAPNGHLFLKPEITKTSGVEKIVAQVDNSLCKHCGRCSEICQYGAVASLPNQTIVFSELCHGCGGCVLVCPTSAMKDSSRLIGDLRFGNVASMQFLSGTLNVGEAMAPPIISAVKEKAPPADLSIVDCPPGTSCPVIECLKGVDFAVLVTEPTPMGLHDLRLAVEVVVAMEIPHGVLINRADDDSSLIHDYCDSELIEVLMEIPDDRAVAEAYSNGIMVCDAVPATGQRMLQLLDRIERGDLR